MKYASFIAFAAISGGLVILVIGRNSEALPMALATWVVIWSFFMLIDIRVALRQTQRSLKHELFFVQVTLNDYSPPKVGYVGPFPNPRAQHQCINKYQGHGQEVAVLTVWNSWPPEGFIVLPSDFEGVHTIEMMVRAKLQAEGRLRVVHDT